MKKIILFTAIALMAFTAEPRLEPTPPAVTTITNGGTVTLSDSNEVEVQFTSKANSARFRYAFVYIVSTTSGVQVSAGEAIVAGNQAWAADSKIPISFINGYWNVRLKGTNGDVIAITY